MKKYTINNWTYNFNEGVCWNDIDESDFYFQRAKFFGLPKPPACFVVKEDILDEQEELLISTYHEKFKIAEQQTHC